MKKSLVLFSTCTIVMGLAGCSSTAEVKTTSVTAAETSAATEIITEVPSEVTSETLIETNTGTTEFSEETVGLANPMVEYKSLGEVNEILGGAMCKPAVMGVTDEKFWTINCGELGMLGQYCYNLNGIGYMMRFSPNQTGDITGVYTNEGNTVYGEPTDEIIEYANDSGILFARWFTIDGQYVFECESNEVTNDNFSTIAEEIYNITLNHAVNQNSDN